VIESSKEDFSHKWEKTKLSPFEKGSWSPRWIAG